MTTRVLVKVSQLEARNPPRLRTIARRNRSIHLIGKLGKHGCARLYDLPATSSWTMIVASPCSDCEAPQTITPRNVGTPRMRTHTHTPSLMCARKGALLERRGRWWEVVPATKHVCGSLRECLSCLASSSRAGKLASANGRGMRGAGRKDGRRGGRGGKGGGG